MEDGQEGEGGLGHLGHLGSALPMGCLTNKPAVATLFILCR